jgi:hypothetical protein
VVAALLVVATLLTVVGVFSVWINRQAQHRPRYAAWLLRREASPYVEDHRGGAYLVAGLVFLALIAWAPIHAFSTALGIILFAVLFALGTELICRQILRESSERAATETGGRTSAAQT